MRALTIISGEVEEFGRLRSVWHKHTGFVKNRELASEIVVFAGWPSDTNCLIEDSRTTEEFFDVDYEEDKRNAELVGNDNYGTIDADLSNVPYTYLEHKEGESWVFVLGDRLHLN